MLIDSTMNEFKQVTLTNNMRICQIKIYSVLSNKKKEL